MMDLKYLHKAIDSQAEDECINLINMGVDINAIYIRETAFTRAILQTKPSEIILENIVLANNFSPNSPNQFNRVPIYFTALKGYINLTRTLVKKGANVNVNDVTGVTPLAATCWENQAHVAEELIKAGACIEARDRDGQTPLMRACSNVAIDVVKVLVNYGADVDAKDKRNLTVLMAALPTSYQIEINHKKLSDIMKIIEMLIDYQCNMDDQDQRGNTALHLATEQKQLEAACLLMERGCNLEIKNDENYTAFQYAVSADNPRYIIAACMVIYGCDVYQIYIEENKCLDDGPLHKFLGKKTNEDTTEDEKILRYILQKELLRHDIVSNNIFSTNNMMHFEVPSLQDFCRLSVRHFYGKELIEHIKTLQIPDTMKNFVTYGVYNLKGHLSNFFASLTAVTEGNDSLVLNWLEHVHIDAAFFGKTLINEAVLSGQEHMLDLLLEKGASVNVKTLSGDTLLHTAARKGHEGITIKLLKANCDPNRKNKQCLFPIHEACRSGHTALIQYLVTDKTPINIPDNNGIFPLHYACANTDASAVQFLIQHGAYLDVVDTFGFTPLHVVATQGFCYLSRNISLKNLFTSELIMNLFMTKVMVDEPCNHDMQVVDRFEIIMKLLMSSGANSDLKTSNGDCLHDLLQKHWPSMLERINFSFTPIKTAIRI